MGDCKSSQASLEYIYFFNIWFCYATLQNSSVHFFLSLKKKQYARLLIKEHCPKYQPTKPFPMGQFLTGPIR